MRFENRWPGDVIAACICVAYDREDAFFESLDGRSWNRVDGSSSQADAHPIAVVLRDRRDTGMVIEGFAFSAATLHPDLLVPPAEHDRCRDLGKNRPDERRANATPANSAGWRVWITSIASIVGEPWSRMLREREIRRISAAWETIDDRTLKDIGVSRCEIKYARDAEHWS